MPALVGTMLVIWQSPALAGDGEGQRNNTSAGASASGGTITVTESPDGGARFQILLPIVKSDPS